MDPKDIVRLGYDRISRAYRGDAIEHDNPEHRRYAAWIGELTALLPAGGRVLDLGCGNGVPVDRLLVDAGYAVHGVDISPVQIARAREVVPGAHYTCADMTTLDWPEATFDAIVCLYALIHVPLDEQPALLDSVARWLRPGGLLLVTVGHRAWTGTEDGWLVPGATMYWSHADADTYLGWFAERGLDVRWSRFVSEGDGGHILVLAARTPGTAKPQ
mgnify:CR=1 FL=1